MNVHRSCSSLGLLLVLAVVFLPSPASAASPGITVTEESVTISLAPSGRVAVMGLIRRSYGRIPGFQRWEGILADDDGDGAVEVVLESPAKPETSLWVAVDLGSGEWATAGRSPDLAEATGLLTTGGESLAGAAVWTLPVGILEVLVVRPGEGEAAGAWGSSVWDGGDEDGDGLEDGSAGVTPATLRPVESSGLAPETFAAGDVLVAIEPQGFRSTITRVGAGGEVLQ